MKKVNILIAVAALFVVFVMISVMREGVDLKERKMVKWSKVESSAVAGTKIARFMFPLLKEFEEVRVVGSAPFAKEFYDSFSRQAQQDKTLSRLFFNQTALGKKHFSKNKVKTLVLSLVDLELQIDKKACQARDKPSCIAMKSLRKFNKKDREPGLWINMFRMNKNQLILFYRSQSH